MQYFWVDFVIKRMLKSKLQRFSKDLVDRPEEHDMMQIIEICSPPLQAHDQLYLQ